MRSLSLTLLAASAAALTVPRHATPVTREELDAEMSASAAGAEYDFIIAGGGITALTLADRLTEDPKVKVLVIEAGPFDKGEDAILKPGSFPPFQYWTLGLMGVPQTELNNRVHPSLTGRLVGGGSGVNAAVFVRSSKAEYNHWAALGAKGWDWHGMFPYFLKSSNFTKPDKALMKANNISIEDCYHSDSGPVRYSYPPWKYPGASLFWQSCLDHGIELSKDPLGGESVGLFAYPFAYDASTRTRSYAKINHYDRVKDARPNYKIMADTTVARVIFQGKKAVGVEYLPSAGGARTQIKAKREIILAAGALKSPQILLNSGVGDRRTLDKFSIPVVEDLPGVGQNFQDQASIEMGYTFDGQVPTPNVNSLTNNATFVAEQQQLLATQKIGALTITNGLSHSLAVAPLTISKNYKEIIAAGRLIDPASVMPADVHPTVLEGYKIQRKAVLDHLADPKWAASMLHWTTGNTNRIYLEAPLSRGYVSINSTDPLANPLINWRSMTDPTDWAVAVATVRKNREIMRGSAMASLGAREAAPMGDDLVTDEQIIAGLRQLINPGGSSHQCCTAAMVPRRHGGVVDPEMQVYGVQALRVVDTGYWPQVLAAAPSATTYASGEKIADIIKKKYRLAEFA